MNGLKTRLYGVCGNRGSQQERRPIHGLFPKRTESLLAALLVACIGTGCVSIPRTKASPPKKAIRLKSPSQLVGKEWFWGVYVMGKRVGYSYMAIERSPSMRDVLKIISKLKIDMGGAWKLEMSQLDYTRSDLTLISSYYSQTYNEVTKMRNAVLSPGKIEVQTTIGETSTRKVSKLDHSVYPSSMMNILPIVRGLWVGSSYRFSIYHPETNSIKTVKQRVKSYDMLEDFGRPAYRLTTKLKGHNTQFWLDADGNVLVEKSKLGIFAMSFILENTE